MPRADLAQTQWIVKRQRMRNTGLVELRRDHPDVVGQFARDLLDDLQPRRVNAVVIGTENPHSAHVLSVDSGLARRAPSYLPETAEANAGGSKNPLWADGLCGWCRPRRWGLPSVLKTAEAAGINVPLSLPGRAEDVIE